MTEASEPPDTLLISLVGKDRPGVTSAIFQTLAEAGVEVLDIEQIVLRRRLILGVLVTAPRDWKRLRTKLQDTGGRPRHDGRHRPGRRATTGNGSKVART